MTYDYEYFKREVLSLTSIDLNCYKEKQMKRRIDTLIAKHKIEGYDRYVHALKTDKDLFEEFVSYITINVSEFYRNPEQWKLLDEEVIPELVKRFGRNLKIWSAACSTGDEPYSLVMALSRHVPEDLKKKYFTQVGPSYKISDEIKARVEFKEHNLLKDIYPTDYHMIVCRNVLIYFTEEAKDEVFCKYVRALAPGGVLFIGSTEQIVNYKEMGYERKNSFFYQKPL